MLGMMVCLFKQSMDLHCGNLTAALSSANMDCGETPSILMWLSDTQLSVESECVKRAGLADFGFARKLPPPILYL